MSTVQTTESVKANPVYENEDTGNDTFEDIGDEPFHEDEFASEDSDSDEFDFSDEDEDSEVPLFKRKQQEAEAKAQKKGERGEQHKVLETITEDEPTEEVAKPKEEVEEESAKEEEKKEEEEPAKEKDAKAPKGKKVFVKVGEETFALDSNATIPHKVDGKVENIPVQELLNNYSGKVAWDKRMNEINLKNQEVTKKESMITEKESKIQAQVQEIMDIINDEEANPFDALYKLVDTQNGDRYDFWERSFKAQLEDLSNVLAMSPVERKAFFLEKKNEFLVQQTEKRREADEQSTKLNRYREQAAALRKSHGVSETQYVDAYEEIKSWGYEPKDISEQQIVEWAAIKPHKQAVEPLLENYRDSISEDSFSELTFKLAGYLRTGEETIESITEQLEEVFGAPSDVKELNRELAPVGRPRNPSKPTAPSKKLESFDDWDEEEDY